jgi:hypothetical protein
MPRIEFHVGQFVVETTPEISKIIKQLTLEEGAFAERRREERYPVSIAIPAIAVDEKYRPLGEAFQVLTRDVSTRGISLIHTEPVKAQFLAIELPVPEGAKTQLVIRVLRCRPVERFYEIGGQFVARLT